MTSLEYALAFLAAGEFGLVLWSTYRLHKEERLNAAIMTLIISSAMKHESERDKTGMGNGRK